MCAHRNQRRKYEDAPYVAHCEVVARTAAEYTDDPNVSVAAFTHDMLEDTDVTTEEMRRMFGNTITGWCWNLTVL